MLNHPTLDRLRELGLDGMAKGFRDLAANPESRALEHGEWLGLLVDQEVTLRQQKRFEARTRTAKLLARGFLPREGFDRGPETRAARTNNQDIVFVRFVFLRHRSRMSLIAPEATRRM